MTPGQLLETLAAPGVVLYAAGSPPPADGAGWATGTVRGRNNSHYMLKKIKTTATIQRTNENVVEPDFVRFDSVVLRIYT